MNTSNAGQLAGPAGVYYGFIEAANRQDLDEAAKFVDAARYKESRCGPLQGELCRVHPRLRELGTGQGSGPGRP
jgi:hypothetical protein